MAKTNELSPFSQELCVERLLASLGEDMGREGLRDTPKRVVKMYQEMFSSLGKKEPDVTVFTNKENYDQLIVESDISFASTCEHHLVPFVGVVHIGYIPGKHYIGLSKLARVVDFYSHKPQVQERLTHEIAEYLYKKMKPTGIVVVVEAEHFCMSIRGVKKPRHNTMTSCILPNPKKFPKEEFFNLLAIRRKQ